MEPNVYKCKSAEERHMLNLFVIFSSTVEPLISVSVYKYNDRQFLVKFKLNKKVTAC